MARQKLDPESKTEIVAVKMPAAEAKLLRERAKAAKMSVSAYLRALITGAKRTEWVEQGVTEGVGEGMVMGLLVSERIRRREEETSKPSVREAKPFTKEQQTGRKGKKK